MAAFLDLCRFNPTAGGTTDWTYSSAVTGYMSPSLAGVVNGRAYKYRAESTDLTQWESGEGTYNTGTGVLTRTTVLQNSSGTGTATGQSGAGTKITFSAAPQVAIAALKEDLISIEEANSFTTAQKTQARSNIGAQSSALVRSSAAGASPGVATASGSVMAGLAGSITPAVTGSIVVTVIVTASNNTATAGSTIQIAYGTGAAPAHNAASTGTATGGSVTGTSATTNALVVLANTAYITGLTPATAYWIDVIYGQNAGGSCLISNYTVVMIEV